MNPLAMELVVCSTFMHAGWNLLARRGRSEVSFFNSMLLWIVVLGLVPALVSEARVHSLPASAWAYAAASGLCCGFYHFFLAKAYESSDFTVVYPIARALPVLLVGLGDVARGRDVTALGWLGMLLVVGGCFLAPLDSPRQISLARYLNKTSLWMLLTAFGTVGYTLLDKMASEVVMQGPATAARYGYVYFSTSYLVFSALLLAFNRKAGGTDRPRQPLPLAAAVLNFGAYWLILWAYQLAERASYIVAFRQFSIVIGVILAFILYRERGKLPRLTAASLITSGLVIIGFLGG